MDTFNAGRRRMKYRSALINRIAFRILIMLLILFALIIIVVGLLNRNNVRSVYEENYSERVLLTNALMATIIDGDIVEYYVELMRNQPSDFKERQVQFYHDRLELKRLQDEGAPKEEQQKLLNSLAQFHIEMSEFKTEDYWNIIAELRRLKEVSHSTYLYVMADTGLVSNDGEKLLTFIFDAEDIEEYNSIEMDGLGTCDISLETIEVVYQTRVQMERVQYNQFDVYGELYYAYAPILNEKGEVIAVFGSDLSLEAMNKAIAASTFLFNAVIMASAFIIVLIIFFFLRRSITTPLSSLTETAYELAEGNVYTSTSELALKQHTEIGMLGHAIRNMSLTYQKMIGSAGRLFESARIGKLGVRNDLEEYKGDIKNVVKQINQTLDSITLYLDNLPEAIFIMSKDSDTYFKNRQFINYFGDISTAEFLSKVFSFSEQDCFSATQPQLPFVVDDDEDEDDEPGLIPQLTCKEYLAGQVLLASRQAGNTLTIWFGDICFSIILKEIMMDEDVENSILGIAIDVTDLMKEKENAQAAAKAKSDFLSRMSHEMRTPMNAIIGMTKIAEGSDDIAKLKYCLSTIGTSSAHLLGIINDVLDMSKIEAGKFELDMVPINIEKTLMKICNIIIDNVEKKHQKFSVALGKNLNLNYITDDLRLSQVLTNLLSNAIKFTPEGGKITLAIDRIAQKGTVSTLRFSISDTGIGMTPEQTARLFNAFEQADGSVSRKFGGTGLGLVISKNIIEKMGGHIWVESELGVGSTFYFDVDLECTSHQDSAVFDGIHSEDIRLLVEESDDDVRAHFMSIAENTKLKALDIKTDTDNDVPDLSDVHILLAEDVLINQDIFVALLEQTNISIDIANNGLIAVEKFAEDPDRYDLIIMDIQMPEMDGYRATKAIRAMDNPRAQTIPVIAVTANVFKEDIERCLESGMDDHLPKPIDEKTVIEKIVYYAKRGKDLNL